MNNEPTINQRKAQDFLAYVAKNEKRLKKNLRKNITYDPDLFDDVFQESIIRCYNSIEKNGTDIKDYEQYFFMSSKWCYVQRDNQKKKRVANELPDYWSYDRHADIEPQWDDETWQSAEQSHSRACAALGELTNVISRAFGDQYAEIYIQYMAGKAEGGTSYKKLAEKYGMRSKDISEIIRPIKQYLSRDPRMNEIKNSYYAND